MQEDVLDVCSFGLRLEYFASLGNAITAPHATWQQIEVSLYALICIAPQVLHRCHHTKPPFSLSLSLFYRSPLSLASPCPRMRHSSMSALALAP
jgi:hypothetical protein